MFSVSTPTSMNDNPYQAPEDHGDSFVPIEDNISSFNLIVFCLSAALTMVVLCAVFFCGI